MSYLFRLVNAYQHNIQQRDDLRDDSCALRMRGDHLRAQAARLAERSTPIGSAVAERQPFVPRKEA